MISSLAVGTVLQNRYRILSILGQGGFGRTYLAEDLGRFQERCAIKEFVPSQSDADFSDKAKELFQREAAILYQIQHPQIPQFRATFEQDGRLFLVQDYVEGKTYRALLNERIGQGTAFSEAEIYQFLQQMLPLLAHIHSKNIIHRDITPDNIILRQMDQQPVLIDFGVVKEVVTRLQLDTEVQATTVGKFGYAPSEQMQTGNAYPSSDLYSLAVTAIVLLTGREPQQLYDDHNSTWRWQQWVNVGPHLAQVLNKALSYRPGDRYQSVREMAQDLQDGSAMPPTAMPNPVAPQSQPTPAPAPRPDNVSQMNTVAVGRRPDERPNPRPNHPQRPPSATQPAYSAEESMWDNPWVIALVGILLAIAAGFGSWAIVRSLNSSDTASPTPTETVTETPTETPSPTPTETEPVEYSQRIELQPGVTREFDGTLQANETINYRFEAEQDQSLNAQLRGEGVLLTLIAPNGEVVSSDAERVLRWQGPLNFSGQYTVQLRPVQGLAESDYRLELTVEAAPEPSPTPTETPTPEPTPIEPEIIEERVQFPEDSTGTTVFGRTDTGIIQRYLVNAQAGQIMSAEILEGAASFTVRYPNGNPVENARRIIFWQSELTRSGDYQIDVFSEGPANYTLEISVINGSVE
ncbi:MAG: protein kinase domain-containing protein [Thainema sp.]